MKKLSIITMMLLCAIYTMAQQPHHINSFFDKNGAVRLETTELKGDTVITLFHRSEDVLWHRTVYSIIDMRFKQNFQMYFPINRDNPRYRSMFGVIVEAICEGLPVYSKSEFTELIPHFENPAALLTKEKVAPLFEPEGGGGGFSADDFTFEDEEGEDVIDSDVALETDEADAGDDLFNMSNSVLSYDAAKDELSVTKYYDNFAKNQIKYLIQEQIFFDKHYSRLYRCITAIAPLHADKAQEGTETYDALYQQIICWIPFAALRPYLAHQYMIASKNNSKRQTYDEFFAQRLYTSYIVGDDNMYDRVIPRYVKTEESMKAEQKRIETELLEFEQNLWEY